MHSNVVFDFDLHGLLGVRLVNASPKDVEAVRRQIGPLDGRLFRQPDITVRFVEQIPTKDLCYVGPKSGFTDDGSFVVVEPAERRKTIIAFDQIGVECKIVCETGIHRVPLLTAILNLTALKKDQVPLHASAFLYNGMGILVTGWAKGGKTEALLAFALYGGEYVGDEWIWLSADGTRMYGVPERIRLWDWHLDYLPELKRLVAPRTRALFHGVHLLRSLQERIFARSWNDSSSAMWLRRAMPALRRQLNVQVPPQEIFGRVGSLRATPDKVFLMMSHQSYDITIEPCDPLQIAHRMAASIRFEQSPLMEHYLAFKFAFPDKSNEFIEHAHELQGSLLRRALAGKEAYVVRHPYPCSFDELFEAMEAYCVAPPRDSTCALTPFGGRDKKEPALPGSHPA